MRNQQGYSFLELVLAMAVGAIVVAGSYTGFAIVSKQYQRNSAFSETQEGGIAAIRILSRDFRMAGFVALDAALESTYGAITVPIAIADSGNACCDSVSIVYDRAMNDRRRISYYTMARTNPARNALFMDEEQWDGSAWVVTVSQALVVDYVEDFQIEGSDLNVNGDPALIDISMILRSKSARDRTFAYTKNAYDIGNYAISTNDLFHRDEFNATINVRNLRQ